MTTEFGDTPENIPEGLSTEELGRIYRQLSHKSQRVVDHAIHLCRQEHAASLSFQELVECLKRRIG